MSNDIVGRVVGYSEFHKWVPIDPRKISGPHKKLDRTIWVRVTGEHRNDPNLIIVQSIHTGVYGLLDRRRIHTTMTKAY